MAYPLTEWLNLGKSKHFFYRKFDEESKYANSFSAIYTRKKIWLIMSSKFWKYFTIFDLPVCSQTKQPPNILSYERSSLHPLRSEFVFTCSSFTRKCQGTKSSMVTKNYISFSDFTLPPPYRKLRTLYFYVYD